jgi:hypothetical protein
VLNNRFAADIFYCEKQHNSGTLLNTDDAQQYTAVMIELMALRHGRAYDSAVLHRNEPAFSETGFKPNATHRATVVNRVTVNCRIHAVQPLVTHLSLRGVRKR